MGKCSREHSREVPGVFHVSSVSKSNRTAVSGELSGAALSFPVSKFGLSFSRSDVPSFKSSCLMLNSGSRFRSCGVIRISSMVCRGCELTYSRKVRGIVIKDRNADIFMPQ